VVEDVQALALVHLCLERGQILAVQTQLLLAEGVAEFLLELLDGHVFDGVHVVLTLDAERERLLGDVLVLRHLEQQILDAGYERCFGGGARVEHEEERFFVAVLDVDDVVFLVEQQHLHGFALVLLHIEQRLHDACAQLEGHDVQVGPSAHLQFPGIAVAVQGEGSLGLEVEGVDE